MKLSSYCMFCLIKRQMEKIEDYPDEELKTKYIKEVITVISESAETLSAPSTIAVINRLHQRYFNKSYSFDELKSQYNELMLGYEDEISEKIQNSQDKLLTALKYARAGNYIDFGAMGSIDDLKLKSLLDSAGDEIINNDEYQGFLHDISNSKSLVYLTDNCGEVVLDKVLIRVIKELYPHIDIKVVVRGKPVLNDATIEDARMVGLCDIVRVIENGTEVAGTDLNEINDETRAVLESSDIIISKGQGNFETLNGCGLNIYYMFLCKCDWFVKRFSLEKFNGVFVSEKNLNTLL